jgi:hypothetical protein
VKPHLETWEADGSCIDVASPYVPHIGQFGVGSADDCARAKLAAQAPAMARLLIAVFNRIDDPLSERAAELLHAAGVIEGHRFVVVIE